MSHRAIKLLRSILRVHRQKLNPQMREIGDKYVLNEFKLHKKTTALEQLTQFYDGWEKYLRYIQNQNANSRFGRDLRAEEQNILSEDQKRKLHEIKVETTTLSVTKLDST